MGAPSSARCMVALALGVVLVAVPIPGFDPASPGGGGGFGPVAAVVAGVGEGYVLGRDGSVVRVDEDGSRQQTASIGRYSTPFGTTVDGRVVFGGVRCEGDGCQRRAAEVTILDGEGRIETAVALRRVARAQPGLDGLALVGADDDTVWVNAAGTLYQVAVSPAAVVAEVPWPGGEPCLIDGVLHDLEASGGTYGQQGADLTTTATFQLRLRAWDGERWRPVRSGARSLAHGANAYCTPEGYEVRAGEVTSAHWHPATGWRATSPGRRAGSPWAPGGDGAVVETIGPVRRAGPADATGLKGPAGSTWRPGAEWLAPVTSSRGVRYVARIDGSLHEVTAAGPVLATGVVMPGFVDSDMPPAVQLDEVDGWLFWCATSYRAGVGHTRCAVARPAEPVVELATGAGSAQGTSAFPPEPGGPPHVRAPNPSTASAPAQIEAHHYNICSAACGDGVRPHTRDVVAWFVDRYRPAALSLNELCYDDIAHLGGRPPAGLDAGTSYVALARATNCPGAVKQFGQVQLVSRTGPRPGPSSASGSSWWAQFPTQATTPCDHRLQECRGVACAETRRDGETTVFCSAHLAPRRRGGSSVATAQAGEYRRLVEERFGNRRVRVLAGDFNLERAAVDAQLVPAGYRSTVVGPTVGEHDPPPSRQIDMIYYGGAGLSPTPTATEVAALPPTSAAALAARTRTAPSGGGTTYCDPQASDHCYLRGW